jgi:hypothetical protein
VLLAVGGTLTAEEAVTGAGHAEVEGAGTLILKGAFNENVTFASGSTGTLELGDSKGYTTGAITGFSKTGANALDLLDIPFVSGTTTATYSGTTTSGVLTVKDGANVATIHLTGNYTTSTFTVSASSAGGTKVVDPARLGPSARGRAPLAPSLHRRHGREPGHRRRNHGERLDRRRTRLEARPGPRHRPPTGRRQLGGRVWNRRWDQRDRRSDRCEAHRRTKQSGRTRPRRCGEVGDWRVDLENRPEPGGDR